MGMKLIHALLRAATAGKHRCPHPWQLPPSPSLQGRPSIESCFLSARHFFTALSLPIMFEQPQLAILPISAASLSSAQDQAGSSAATQPARGRMARAGRAEGRCRCCWGRCGVSPGRGAQQESPAVPAQPREAQQGSKRATKAVLEGDLRASRGSAPISRAWRFLAALALPSPYCPGHLVQPCSEPLPTPCIPLPKAGPCTGSWSSTRIQCGFSLRHAARCRPSCRNAPLSALLPQGQCSHPTARSLSRSVEPGKF